MNLRPFAWLPLLLLVTVSPALSQTDERLPTLPPQKILFPVEVPAMPVGMPGDSAWVAFYTPAELDQMLTRRLPRDLPPELDSLRLEVIRQFNTERAELKKKMAKKFGRPVMIVMVVAMTHDDNEQAFVLYPDYEIGIQRDQRDIPALTAHELLWVEASDTASIYIVLPEIKLEAGDAFYIKVPESK